MESHLFNEDDEDRYRTQRNRNAKPNRQENQRRGEGNNRNEGNQRKKSPMRGDRKKEEGKKEDYSHRLKRKNKSNDDPEMENNTVPGKQNENRYSQRRNEAQNEKRSDSRQKPRNENKGKNRNRQSKQTREPNQRREREYYGNPETNRSTHNNRNEGGNQRENESRNLPSRKKEQSRDKRLLRSQPTTNEVKQKIEEIRASPFLPLEEKEKLIKILSADVKQDLKEEKVRKNKGLSRFDVELEEAKNAFQSNKRTILKRIDDLSSEILNDKTDPKIKENYRNRLADLIESEKVFEERYFRMRKEQEENRSAGLFWKINAELNHLKTSLPVYSKYFEIQKAFETNQFVFVSGESESGMSLHVPQYLHDYKESKRGRDKKVLCSQPSLLAARLNAISVAEEYKENLGKKVNYLAESRERLPGHLELVFMEDRAMLELLASENIGDLAGIVVDGFSQRSPYTDLLLGYLKLKANGHPSFRVVICSDDSNDEEVLRTFFRDLAAVNIPKRSFPVKTTVMDQDYASIIQSHSKEETPKTILVLLSSNNEVLNVSNQLKESLGNGEESENNEEVKSNEIGGYARPKGRQGKGNFIIHGIHESSSNQDLRNAALNAKSTNETRVILAKSLQETIMIQGVSVVIDSQSGEKVVFSEELGQSLKKRVWNSKKETEKRKKRAGEHENAEYICFEGDLEVIDEKEPQIMRSPLEKVVLFLKKIGINQTSAFPFISIPPAKNIKRASDLLKMLGAIENETENITETGVLISRLGFPLSISKMIVESQRLNKSCLAEAILIATILEFHYAFYKSTDEYSDQTDIEERYQKAKMQHYHQFGDAFSIYQIFYTINNLLISPEMKENWCQNNFIALPSMTRLAHDFKHNFKRVSMTVPEWRMENMACEVRNLAGDLPEKLLYCVLAGFSPTLSKHQGFFAKGYWPLFGRSQIKIEKNSVFHSTQLFPREFIIFKGLSLSSSGANAIASWVFSIPYRMVELEYPKALLSKLSLNEAINSQPFREKFRNIPSAVLKKLEKEGSKHFWEKDGDIKLVIDAQKNTVDFFSRYDCGRSKLEEFKEYLEHLEIAMRNISSVRDYGKASIIAIDAYGEIQSMLFQDEYLKFKVSGFSDRQMNWPALKNIFGQKWLGKGRMMVEFDSQPGADDPKEVTLRFADKKDVRLFQSEKEKDPSFTQNGFFFLVPKRETGVEGSIQLVIEAEWPEKRQFGDLRLVFNTEDEALTFFRVTNSLKWGSCTFELPNQRGKEVIVKPGPSEMSENECLLKLNEVKTRFHYAFRDFPKVFKEKNEKPLSEEEMKEKLENFFRTSSNAFESEDPMDIFIQFPNPGIIIGIVEVKGNLNQEQSLKEINAKGCFLGAGRISINYYFEYVQDVSLDKWSIIQAKFNQSLIETNEALKATRNLPIVSYLEENEDRSLSLKVTSASFRSLKMAQKNFDLALKGEELELSKRELAKMSSDVLKRRIVEIEKELKVKIEKDESGIWAIFGQNTQIAKQKLQQTLDLKAQKGQNVFLYSLEGKNLRTIFIEKPREFERLKLRYSREAKVEVALSNSKKRIVINGPVEAFKKIKRELDELLQIPLEEEETCGICLSIFRKKFIFGNCKHEICQDCLVAHFQKTWSSGYLFCPFCRGKVLYGDFKLFLGWSQIEKMLQPKIQRYLVENSKEIQVCSVIGCQEPFRKSTWNGKYVEECEECRPKEKMAKEKPKERKTCRFCPFCAAPVPRKEEANHIVSCPCGAHFCLKCIEGFESKNEKLEHIANEKCVI